VQNLDQRAAVAGPLLDALAADVLAVRDIDAFGAQRTDLAIERCPTRDRRPSGPRVDAVPSPSTASGARGPYPAPDPRCAAGGVSQHTRKVG
jgi:hypothetical protein